MGRAVALHPVAVILAVAAGSYIAGIAGALFAVPTLAVTNAAVRYIASRSWENSWETEGATAPAHAGRAPDSPEAP